MNQKKSENVISIEAFDIAEMPKAVRPIGSSVRIDTRDCNWYAAHGKIDGKKINSPLIGIHRDRRQVFIGDTRKPDEFYPVDMAYAKALRTALDKLIDG